MSNDTAVAHDLIPPENNATLVANAVGTLQFDEPVDACRLANTAADAIAETLGEPAVRPFQPDGGGVDELFFGHRQIAAHAERGRFCAVR